MEDKNLQEQYALLEEEKRENQRRTIILIIIFILIILFILLGLFFTRSENGGSCKLNCKSGDKWYNVDVDNDGICDVNCKVTGSDGKNYIINIDYNNDRVVRFNIDTNGDGIPDTNLVNKDIDGDGKPDLNIDIDNDGYPDINLDMNNENVCSLNCDITGDNKCDLNCDTNNDNVPDKNIDRDGDSTCDVNCDTDNDGKCDLNCDTNGDGKPDTNVDDDDDGEPDVNIDDDDDGECDLNCDTNGDGEPDTNVDNDNDGECDVDCDTNGDGECDVNCSAEIAANANLKSLKVGKYVLYPNFDEDVTEYTVKVESDLESVLIEAEAVNPNAKITGIGNVKLDSSSTRVSIVVVAEDGTMKTYYVTINRVSGDGSVEENGDSDFEVGTLENNSLIVSYTKDFNVKNIIPGWTGSQTFELTNKSDKTIVYNVNLLNVVNTFKSNDFRYTLIKDNKVIVGQTPALRSDGPIYQKLVIAPGETAKFELKFEFINHNYSQNEDLDVQYSSKVEIQIVSVN